jgi:hypothetical protein
VAKGRLSDFHIKTNEVILHEDNQPAIKIAHNPEVRKIKHLDKFKDGIIKIVYVPSTDQIADMFTKCLGNNLFIQFRDKVFNV